MPNVDMSVTLAGVTLKNPVVVASGTFGFGREYNQFYDLGELGGICAKGLTLHRREGNPAPRIAETPMGILNSVGLQNPGVDAFIEEELPFLRQFDTKVIANISGNTPEEYGVMCEKLSEAGVDMIEVNISCPNVKAGGLAYGTRPELAAEVTKVAKAHAGKTPVMVKLSPQRHRRHRDRQGGGRRRGGRPVPHQHPAGDAHRREHRPAHFEDEHRRPVRPRRPACGGADGLGGVLRPSRHAHPGHGRGVQGGGRGPADAGGGLRRGGGHRPVCRPPTPPSPSGTAWSRSPPERGSRGLRAHRRS